MTTREDVARRAGVSPSTVSYALNGQRPISPATRERVEAAMRDLEYAPNAFAAGLAGARKGILALHYPADQHGLGTTQFEYVAAASERARHRGYHLLLWTNPSEDLAGLTALLNQGLVDGILLMEVMLNDPRIPVLQHARVPFATIGRPADSDGIIYVDDDFDSLAQQAIDHAADLGHRNVVYLTQPREIIESGHGPLARTGRAIATAATHRGITLTPLHAPGTVRAGHDALTQLQQITPRPSAIISFNEMATSGLLHAAAVANLAIPEQLTIIVLSMAPAAATMLTPPLTTVSPPSKTIAASAIDALTDLIEDKTIEMPQRLITPTLTIRASSARPAPPKP
jgi:DNA-binding LacI/PurR family transcriptional regulator